MEYLVLSLLFLAILGVVFLIFYDKNLKNKEEYPEKRDIKSVESKIELRSLEESLPEQFIIFDFETTGLYADRHEIIEIGAIRVQRDSDVHATFQTLVRPKKRVPSKIVDLTGITNEMLEQDGVFLEEAMREFSVFVGNLPMVAFNARFDKSFLEAASAQTGIVIENEISCALEAAKAAWPGRESYKLKDLAAAGGLSLDDTHRALADCQRTAIIYSFACRWPKEISAREV